MLGSIITPEHAARTTILVVDDDPMIRDVLVESIELVGYKVDFCGDGAEALEKNAEHNYDIIITDMRLPGLDGLSLIRRLKSGTSDTDVIVITGYGTIENAVECMKAGAADYLIKPFTMDQIHIAVNKAVEHRELRRRAREREFYMELSYVDALTGINNRRFLDESLESEIQKAARHGTSVVLLMLDIDDFKVYNDRNGHQKGDQALARLGRLFKSVCRSYDIVTRYGGEEFAIVFPRADKSNAVELSGRIIKEVRETAFEGEDLLPSGSLTVSIGVAAFPEHARDAAGLIRCADQALYAAKRAGKNNIKICDPSSIDSTDSKSDT